jgi:hypothetical protein
LFGFASVEGRRVEAGFDGGTTSSDAGAVLLALACQGCEITCVRMVQASSGASLLQALHEGQTLREFQHRGH